MKTFTIGIIAVLGLAFTAQETKAADYYVRGRLVGRVIFPPSNPSYRYRDSFNSSYRSRTTIHHHNHNHIHINGNNNRVNVFQNSGSYNYSPRYNYQPYYGYGGYGYGRSNLVW